MFDTPRVGATPTNCAECEIRRQWKPLSEASLEMLDLERTGVRHLPQGAQIYVEGDPALETFTLYSGWAFRYRLLADGRRQIFGFVLPGDFLGLQSDLRGNVNHGAEAVTSVTLCTFRRAKLIDRLRTRPELGWRLSRIMAREEALLFDHMMDAGRRSATERVCHLLLELHARLRERGIAQGNRCIIPLTQAHIADAVGLSVAHVNRVLRRLRERSLLTLSDQALTIHDFTRVAEMSEFRPSSDPPTLLL